MRTGIAVGLVVLLTACVAGAAGAAKVAKTTAPAKVAQEPAEKVLTTKGKLAKVDSVLGNVYVRQDGRVIKLQADPALCYSLAKKANKTVVVKYVKGGDGSLTVRDIHVQK